MTSKEKATTDGVTQAWSWWLDEHPISVPEIIGKAAEKVFAEWLRANSPDLIEAIAQACAKRMPPRGDS